MKTYVGIDLAGPRRPWGWAIIDQAGTLRESGVCSGDDDEVLALVARAAPEFVAIDAPLGLPEGLCCLDAGCSCTPTRTPGIRLSEQEVRALGYGLYITTKRTIIPHLVARGIRLRAALESAGVRVLEVYPFASKVALFGRPIPKKTTPAGRAWLQDRVGALVPGLSARVYTHDELDAIIAAYTALLLARGHARAYGDVREGTIVVPDAVHTTA